ncbi:MAG TPA: hypothetical protein PLN54_05125 [Flavobacteriales bacterium]|nr:hypothetical protein [Flavobacteriales bacterium]
MKTTRLFTLLVLWTMIAPAWSQFVIPDWRFRDRLEQIVPAAVNGDTLITDHPDVLALTSMTVGENCVNCTPPNPQNIAGIEYFVNLEYLNISFCEIGQVQNLPNNIRELRMDYIPDLTYIDHWPDSARYISAMHDYYWDGPSTLQPVPPLPPYLEYLDLYANLLDTLRDIPPTLRQLKMDRNRLDYFPVLPNELRHLNIRGNLVPSIPSFPDSLRYLDVGGLNPYPSLPPFPPLLEQFHCTYINTLQEFPPFPPTLQVINTTGTNTACYPYVPPSVTSWNVSTGLACIPNLPPFLSSGNAATKPICTIINSTCPTMSGATGTLFLDDNGDGLWDSGEPPLSSGWVIEAGGGNMAGINATGHYFLPLDVGEHTVTGGAMPWMTQTTPALQVSITQPFQVDSLNHIGFQVTPGVVDLDVQLYTIQAPPRPGFTHKLRLVVRNVGTQLTSGTVSFEHDPTDLWLSATIAPTTQAGTSATWDTGILAPGQAFEVTITLTTPTGVPIGTVLAHAAQVSCNDTEVLLGNNAIMHEQIVVGSYDPNDKNVWPATLSPQELQEGTRITYTIRFQNTGTFLADRVVITDTLPDGLQWNSVAMLDASHPFNWFLNNGVLHFIFDDINLPDSQSDEPGSHGQVRFTVLPSQDLLPGGTVLNAANIYFDFNPPVITEPSVLVVEFSTSLSENDAAGILLSPVPVGDRLSMQAKHPITALQVLFADGRSVLRSSGPQATIAVMDVSLLPPGTYLLRASLSTGEQVHARFIKY